MGTASGGEKGGIAAENFRSPGATRPKAAICRGEAVTLIESDVNERRVQRSPQPSGSVCARAGCSGASCLRCRQSRLGPGGKPKLRSGTGNPRSLCVGLAGAEREGSAHLIAVFLSLDGLR
ncbi:hypothetical protein AAFF_G00385410 [Aldrovandia affinis]|uniref:Uncharacterized protein n=1 Tax=Aldrovandia affinis TaxID=143900 RepID=A0AAD7WLP0_9TELE|nr:hypothetical protein AAFF_G00385410 [Aldrovandia affinis]